MCSFIQRFFMRSAIALLIALTIGVLPSCVTPSVQHEQSLINEITIFMDAYARMLRERDLDGMANLYADSASLSLQGNNQMLSLDSIRAMYQKSSRERIAFRWEDLRIQAMGGLTVLVTAHFYWNDDGPAAYTGVFIKTEQGWRITHEHESFRCK
jgi:ketosteroid isomerase-like protein